MGDTTAHTPPGFVWFDFGGVLSPPIEDLFEAYHGKSGIPTEDLKCAMAAVARELGVPTLAPVELGMLTEPAWGRRLRIHLTEHHPETTLERARLENFGEQWFAQTQPNQPMISLVRELADRGIPVGVLSNNVTEWKPYWRPLIEEIEDYVVAVLDSSEIGARKPDPEIFQLAEKTSATPPASSVLVDDLPENCSAARARGWRSVHFRANTQARKELLELLS